MVTLYLWAMWIFGPCIVSMTELCGYVEVYLVVRLSFYDLKTPRREHQDTFRTVFDHVSEPHSSLLLSSKCHSLREQRLADFLLRFLITLELPPEILKKKK